MVSSVHEQAVVKVESLPPQKAAVEWCTHARTIGFTLVCVLQDTDDRMLSCILQCEYREGVSEGVIWKREEGK